MGYGFPRQGPGPFLGMTHLMQLSACMFLQSFTHKGTRIPQSAGTKFLLRQLRGLIHD